MDYEPCFADRETEARKVSGFFKATQGLHIIPDVGFPVSSCDVWIIPVSQQRLKKITLIHTHQKRHFPRSPGKK